METLTNTLDSISKGKWKWQSNPDPWSETEPPQWEPYSLDHNYLIEKAYYDQQKEVDLGDYLVYPLDMLQRKKGNPQAQRPIKRVDWTEDEEMNDRSARYFDTELPKTINRVFGGLGDFISFFSRRNKEILEFTSQFKELEESNDLGILNHKIAPKLVECLEEVLLKPIIEQGKNISLSQFKKKMLAKVEELISPFRKSFSSFEEFHGQILKAYTMNTGLYPDLNKYLRNESWMEVDKLLPYAFCLCKAFYNLKLKPNLIQEIQEPNNSSEKQAPEFLYRGTSLDEFALSFYDKYQTKYFSWNGVTSTTTNKDKAEEFMHKSVDLEKKKYPAMFIIEIPKANDLIESEKYLRWLNVRQYSAIPSEDEVILPPGSVFELVKVSTDKDKKTIIQIKLKNEVQSLIHGGMMMQGTLQSKLMTEKEAKLLCLDGEELSQALVSFHGNQLVEKVEFCLCVFDPKLLEKMFQILPTIENLKTLKFISCTYQGNEETIIQRSKEGEKCKVSRIEVIETNNFFQIICNEKWDQEYWVSLKELDLDFKCRRNLTDEALGCAVSQRLKYFSQLTYISLNCEKCEEITDKGVDVISTVFNSLIQLTYLNLSFQECERITDEGLSTVAQRLNSLPRLTDLNLNFKRCNQIKDKGISDLAQSLSSLNLLTHLNLDFLGIAHITDEGLKILAEALDSLPQLTHITFHFSFCEKIDSLAKLLSPVTQLTHLYLDFSFSESITNEAMKILAEGLDSLTKLTHLTLKLYECKQIMNEAVFVLAKAINSLAQLIHLDINFGLCEQITDVGVKDLAKGLTSLTHLTHLNLDFQFCKQITNEGVYTLSKELNSLVQLTHLTLDFGFIKPITDEGVNMIAKRLNSLTQLTHLTLDFRICQITDKGLSILSEELSSLPQLTHLDLDFACCGNVTAEGVEILMSQGLKNLTKLTSLHLGFFYCMDILDKDIEIPACKYLKHLNLFTSLIVKDKILQNIDVQTKRKFFPSANVKVLRKSFYPEKQTGEEVSAEQEYLQLFERSLTQELIKSMIFLLGQNQSQTEDPGFAVEVSDLCLQIRHLTSLFLDFGDYGDFITDKLVHNLASQVLGNLPELRSLTMLFSQHNQITDQGIGALASYGLKPLTNLSSLKLNFSSCNQVTEKGVIDLFWEGLKYLSHLKSLDLDFPPCALNPGEELMNYAWNGLGRLSQLESLTLSSSYKITDEGIDGLITQGLQYLTQLKSLSLQICLLALTDQGVNNLILQVVNNLPKLTSFQFDLGDCQNISDFTYRNIIKVLHYFGFTEEIDSQKLTGTF